MKLENIFIEADELMTRLEDPNLRIYDATILFFRSESDPATAYEKYLQGHIPRPPFSTTRIFPIRKTSMSIWLQQKAIFLRVSAVSVYLRNRR